MYQSSAVGINNNFDSDDKDKIVLKYSLWKMLNDIFVSCVHFRHLSVTL